MNSENREIRGYNVISAAAVVAALGISFAIVSVVSGPPGLDVYSIIGGLGLAWGFAGLYLGVQWEVKSAANVYIAIVVALLGSLALVYALSVL